MNYPSRPALLMAMAAAASLAACAVQNPYAATNRSYRQQVKAYAKS